MPVFNNILAGASGATGAAAFQIDRSLRFNSADSAYLNRTPSSAGNRKTWTWSGWVKRSKLGAIQYFFGAVPSASAFCQFGFNSDDTLRVQFRDSSANANSTTDAVFRDVGAWYHIVFYLDTTQSTASDRMKTWVNGVEQTFSTDARSSITQDGNYEVNNTSQHVISSQRPYDTAGHFDGYLTEIHFVDGSQLAASDFGEYDDNNVWQAKNCQSSLTYGTNGFYLKFADNSSNSALGTDSSGNSNTWTVTNLVAVPPTLNGVSFDGSGDRLVVADDADLAFGTGEFTVEMYFICDTVSGNDVLYDSRAQTGSPSDGFSIVRNGNQLRTYTSGAYQVTSSVTLSTGQLYHLAITRESTTQKMYLDGTLVGSATVSNNFSQQKATIGSDVNGGESWDGFISNVRLVKGTAVYTANFTAPSSALTNVTNTVLLCCQSSSSTTAATVSPGTITAHGDVAVASHTYSGEGIDSLIDTPTNYEAASGNNGGNHATMNPLDNANGLTLSNGNLDAENTAGSNKGSRLNFKFPSSGKWYIEATALTLGGNLCLGVSPGDQSATVAVAGTNYILINSSGSTVERYSGGSNVSYSSAFNSYSTGAILQIAYDADSQKLWFGLNNQWMDSGTTVTGNPSSGSNPTLTSMSDIFPSVSLYTSKLAINAGQRSFSYTPPTDFKSLCTQNFADPTIADGSTAMDIDTYTGNGMTHERSEFSFSPDFVWIKRRNGTNWHQLFDTVRGATKRLYSNETNAENTASGSLDSFDSDGFTLGSDGAVNNGGSTYVAWAWDGGTVANPVGDIWQGSATKYIGVKFASASGGTVSYGQTSGSTTVEVWTSSDNSSWTQQGGTLTLSDGHTLTTSDQYVVIRNTTNATFTNWFAAATDGADGHYSSVTYPSGASWSGPPYTDYDWRDAGGVINEDGSIPSIVRANTSTGFSICTYTGSTGNQSFGHGLNDTPKLIAIKNRSNSANWFVMVDIGTTYYKYGHFNTTDALADATAQPVSSTTVTLGNNNAWFGANGDNYVALCWAPVSAYSAMGSYTGNGSSDGSFVFTGFSVAFLLAKNISSGSWYIFDKERPGYNLTKNKFYTNFNNAEAIDSLNCVDLLSNGFKLRGTGGDLNSNGGTYVYAAFAENPFKTARAR